MPRKRVLIVHPYLHPSGGGNAVAAWALQALRESCDLSLATLGPVDFSAVNRNFGTSLAAGDVDLEIAPQPYQRLLRSMPTPGALLQCCLVMRLAQDLDRRNSYDVLFSTQNEADLGRRGMQYIHHPWAYLPRPGGEMRWYHRVPGTLWAYRALCRRLARASRQGLRRNLTLANSQYIAERYRETHQAPATVLYPPVPGEFPDVAWAGRRPGFVAAGRIHGSKRWELAVRILDQVRSQGHDVSLTLIGHRDDAIYAQRLEALAAARPWFRILHDLSRQQLACEMARHRYAIHAMEGEHFGIAPAETQRAGCITFVHNSGGPVEIVGANPHLTFDTLEDAVRKISRVLSNSELEAQLRGHVAARRERFTTEHFCCALREIIDNFV